MMSKKTTVFVTGASGFIGAQLCHELLKKGFRVFGLYHKNQARLSLLKKNWNFKAVMQDIDDPEGLNRVIRRIKPETVFHTAAKLPATGPENPQLFFKTNFTGTLNLLEACRLNDVTTVIHSSSMSVYGNKTDVLPVDENQKLSPYDFYSQSKKMSEDLCAFYARTFGLNIIILRYAGVFGPGRRSGAVAQFIQSALKNRPLSMTHNISWDIVDVIDVAKANVEASGKTKKLKFEILNIGRGQDINIVDLAKKIVTLTGSKSELLYESTFKKNPYRFYFDIRRAEKILHFQPTSLEKSLKAYIDFLKT